jgi:hypothetical protein
MDVTALLQSRVQFASIVSFHIIFPSLHDRVGGLADRAIAEDPASARPVSLVFPGRSFPQTAYRGVVPWQKR